MNRELKFRVWDTKEKRFIVDGFEESLYLSLNYGLMFINTVGEPVDVEKERYLIQQYIGLKDKNGKEIYEGDIVKIEDKEEVRIYDIVFSHGYFGLNRGSKFKHALMYPYTEIIEVIGNIFENPNLLNIK